MLLLPRFLGGGLLLLLRLIFLDFRVFLGGEGLLLKLRLLEDELLEGDRLYLDSLFKGEGLREKLLLLFLLLGEGGELFLLFTGGLFLLL